MPELTRPTVTLHYEDSGGPGQAIIFLHGWCDGSRSWAEFRAALRAFLQGL